MRFKTFESYSTNDWKIISYDNDKGKILSVERTSDGEIFSLGDTIGYVPDGKEIGKIDRLWKSFEQMRIDVGKLGVVLNDEIMKIKDMEELKESVGTNPQLLRQMVQLSNNSRLTQEAAIILSENLTDEQMNRILQWFYHANRS